VAANLEADFCVDALREAANRYGAPEELSTPIRAASLAALGLWPRWRVLGRAKAWTGVAAGATGVMVERLWRSVKYDEVYLKAYDSVSAACEGIGQYIDFYNARRPHQSHSGRTPDMVYHETLMPMRAGGATGLVMST
jgi:putative transposase